MMMGKRYTLGVAALCCMPLLSWGQSNTAIPSSAQAELFMQLQQMQNQITRLQGTVEEQQLKLDQLQKESLERYQILEKRLSTAPVNHEVTTTQTPAGAEQDKKGAIDASATPAAPKDQPKTTVANADPDKEKLYYEAAFGLVRKKDYANAIKAFSAFIDKFPKSQYAGNAQYWLAEVYLAEGNVEQAAVDFKKVLQLYPDHRKVPDAMYKLAGVLKKLEHNKEAKTMLNELLQKYPNTTAATLAKQHLN